jgi:hypothetical protein
LPAAYEEIDNADLSRKSKDRLWDTNLFKSENINGTSSNEKVFEPTLTGFEEYDDFPTLRFVSLGKYRHIVWHIHLQVQL